MYYLDPNDYRTAQIAEEIQRNVVMDMYLQLIQRLNPKFGKDGNQFYYLYGEDLQSGVAGFGETADKAMQDFWMNFHNQKA